jgi:ribosomal protein S18 acetylase RimI-like enzyme
MNYSNKNIDSYSAVSSRGGPGGLGAEKTWSGPARPLPAPSINQPTGSSGVRIFQVESGWGQARLLPWDTEFFGYPCARLDSLIVRGNNQERFTGASDILSQIIPWADENGVKFVSVKVSGPDPVVCQALEQVGFYLTDCLVSLSRTNDREMIRTTMPDAVTFTGDIGEPAETARYFRELFFDGRFHNDARLNKKQADDLWEQAIKNQLANGSNQKLLMKVDSIPSGLAIFRPVVAHNPSGVGSLFVMGLTPGCRGRGLGKVLLTEAMARLAGQYSELEVETSTYNYPAVRVYQFCGFQPRQIKLSLHWRR